MTPPSTRRALSKLQALQEPHTSSTAGEHESGLTSPVTSRAALWESTRLACDSPWRSTGGCPICLSSTDDWSWEWCEGVGRRIGHSTLDFCCMLIYLYTHGIYNNLGACLIGKPSSRLSCTTHVRPLRAASTPPGNVFPASDGRSEGTIKQRPQGSRAFDWRRWQAGAAQAVGWCQQNVQGLGWVTKSESHGPN